MQGKYRLHTGLIISPILCLLVLLSGCKGKEQNEQSAFEHSNNVFAEVENWYVNPQWSERASASGGEAIAQQSTAVWLYDYLHVNPDFDYFSVDEVLFQQYASTTPPITLEKHLKEAEKQGNALITLVLQNLPLKRCYATLNRNAVQLGVSFSNATTEQNLAIINTYQHEYIDPIAQLLGQFPHVPVAIVIEPQSWPHLLVSKDANSDCDYASNDSLAGYTNGIRYAINQLSRYPNAHLYLDIGGSNHLGWDAELSLSTLFMHGMLTGFDELQSQALDIIENDPSAVDRLPEGVDQAFVEPPPLTDNGSMPPGYDKIDGFISNVSDYVPLTEPYLDESNGEFHLASFYNGNPHLGELSYTKRWLESLQTLAPEGTQDLGVLIDTSRNGWGMAQQQLLDAPAADTMEQLTTQRIDQREHRKNWCNQASGIGERPKASPQNKPWIDAYVWAKPPGESDGVASTDNSDQSLPLMLKLPLRGQEEMCDPNGENRFAEQDDVTAQIGIQTGAMNNSPWFDEWFQAHFETLIENAWPSLCEGVNDNCN